MIYKIGNTSYKKREEAFIIIIPYLIFDYLLVFS